MKTILLAGGAGYIGSHTAVELLNAGFQVVVADNYSNSCPEAVKRVEEITGKSVKLYEVDIKDSKKLETVFQENHIDAVIHFAGLKAVGESVQKPLLYYRNNIDTTLSLLECMQKYQVNNIIFSSSATVYGEENPVPYTEEMKRGTCTNPYGWTKVMMEQILEDAAKANEALSVILLRYFNPIGAHESGKNRRRSPGHPEQSDAVCGTGRSGQTGQADDLRTGLRHAGRNLPPGLHPCCRSGKGSRQSHRVHPGA